MDYNADIPFEKKPATGFFDTSKGAYTHMFLCKLLHMLVFDVLMYIRVRKEYMYVYAHRSRSH